MRTIKNYIYLYQKTNRTDIAKVIWSFESDLFLVAIESQMKLVILASNQ